MHKAKVKARREPAEGGLYLHHVSTRQVDKERRKNEGGGGVGGPPKAVAFPSKSQMRLCPEEP